MLHIAGANFSDLQVRGKLRMAVLQASAGLEDHFAIRHSKPPYSLAVLAEQGATFEEKSAAVAALLAEPLACLPFFCRRLRQVHTTREALLQHLPAIIRSWGESTPISVTQSENTHALMRLDLQSSGPGRNVSASSHRIFCRQVRACHVARGGEDPSLQHVLSHCSSSSGPSQGRRKVSACRPHVALMNSKVAAYKQVKAKGRAMSRDEMASVRAAAMNEWTQQGPVERDAWRALVDAQCQQGTIAQHDRPRQVAQPNFEPLWGVSSHRSHVIDLQAFVEFEQETLSQGDKLSDMVWNGKGCVVRDSPQRCVAAPHAWSEAFGCYCNKKNICRVHGALPDEELETMDALTQRLSDWMSHVGKQGLIAGRALLWLRGVAHGAGDAAAELDIIAFVPDARFSPKMQYFIRCHLPCEAPDRIEFVRPEYPFVVKFTVAPSRYGDDHHHLRVQTSDEFAIEVARVGRNWKLFTLHWEDPVELPGLMCLRVVGNDEEFVKERRSHPRRATVPDCFAMGDPLQCGRDAAAASRNNDAEIPPGGSSDALIDGAVDDVEADDLRAAFDAAPWDLLEDMIEDVEDHFGMPESLLEPAADDVAGDDPMPDDVLAEADTPAGDEEAGPPDDGDDALLLAADTEAGEEPEASLDDAVAAAVVTPLGYVSCPLCPFNHRAAWGRITTFPTTKPVHARSVACRCYCHSNCSVVKPRRVASDAQLVRWLFSAKLEGKPSRARVKELAAEHQALLPGLLATSLGSAVQHLEAQGLRARFCETQVPGRVCRQGQWSQPSVKPALPQWQS